MNESLETASALRIKPRRVSEPRDLVLVVLLAVFAVFLTDAFFFTGLNLGVSLGLIGICACFVWYLWKARRAVTAYAVFCFLCLPALAVSLFCSDDSLLKFLACTAILILAAVGALDLLNLRREQTGTCRSVLDVGWVLFSAPFCELPESVWAVFHRNGAGGAPKTRRIGAALIGVGCAIPALFVVMPLLTSSDAAFEGLVRRLTIRDLPIHVIALIVGVGLGLLVFSQLFYLPQAGRKETRSASAFRGVEPLIVGSFLTVLSLVYLAYLLSQGAYFFEGFRGLLPAGYTPAMYARRGFFEMCTICVMNLVFFFGAASVCRRREGRLPAFIRLLMCFLCLFSLTLVAISASKMVLYIRSFGMTRLRILTSAFMLVLAVGFICLILRLFRNGVPYLKVTLIAAAAVLLVLSFVNVDRIVASYNTAAYRSGALSGIDVKTISELSDAAVPSLLDLADDADPVVARLARAELVARVDAFFKVGPDGRPVPVSADWRGYNLVSARAKALLLQSWDRIQTWRTAAESREG